MVHIRAVVLAFFVSFCSLNASVVRVPVIDRTGLLQDTAAPCNTGAHGLIYTTTIDQTGKLVVGGQYGLGALSIRYTASAARDETFGVHGSAPLVSLAAIACLRKIINSPTGYVAVGLSNISQITTLTLTSSGFLDGTFNTNGMVVESGLGISAAYDVVMNGTALTVVGVTHASKPSLLHYNTVTGMRDTCIGDNGVQLFNKYGSGSLYSISSVGFQKYGIGQINSSAFLKPLVDQTGLLQDTCSPLHPRYNSFIYTTTIDQKGNLVIGGQHGNKAVSIRYTSTGTRDKTFGNGGVVKLNALEGVSVLKKIINNNDGYIAAGVSNAHRFTTVTLTATGGFNNTFNGTGIIAESEVGVSSAYDLLVNGTALTVVGVTDSDKPTVIQYDTDTGARDIALENNGLQVYMTDGPGTLYGIGITQEALRYGAGFCNNAACIVLLDDEPIAPIDDALALPTLGIKQDTAYPFTEEMPGCIYHHLLDAHGCMVVCGSYNNAFFLIRYTASGQRDSTFGVQGNGVVVHNEYAPCKVQHVLQDKEHNYYLIGYITFAGVKTLMVAKYSHNGLLDTTFGDNGFLKETSFRPSKACSGIIRKDGTILLSGQVTIEGMLRPALFLYDQKGALVKDFAKQGIRIYRKKQGCVHALLPYDDTHVIAAGSSHQHAMVMKLRYNMHWSRHKVTIRL